MLLYHGTSSKSVKKILKNGYIDTSLNLKNKKRFHSENMINGVYLTNYYSAIDYANGSNDFNIYKNKLGHWGDPIGAVIEFEFNDNDIKHMRFGEKTLNFYEFDENLNPTGNYIYQNYMGVYRYDKDFNLLDFTPNASINIDWEYINIHCKEKADKFRDQLNILEEIPRLNKLISLTNDRYSSFGIDLVYMERMPINLIKNIYVCYDYNETLKVDINNFNKELKLIEKMKHPNIDWSEHSYGKFKKYKFEFDYIKYKLMNIIKTN